MKTYLLRAVLFAACLTPRLAVAEEPTTPPPLPAPAPPTEAEKKQEEAVRARLADHAMKKANPAAAAATAAPGTAAAPATSQVPEAPTMLMPRVEVSKSRITELAIALHEKDVEIAREKKNIKPSSLDSSINDSEVAHKLAIFGGASADDRSRLAEDRVMLLEAERDLIEQIFNARSDEERATLQKQMDDLKTMRRQLERTPKDTRGE